MSLFLREFSVPSYRTILPCFIFRKGSFSVVLLPLGLSDGCFVGAVVRWEYLGGWLVVFFFLKA